MLYSFIIIGYDEERNARRCIDSILALKGLQDYEILFVNDGSVDGTAEVVRSMEKAQPAVRLIDLVENQGRGHARHLGAKRAKGDYVIFVDADIKLPPEWLEACLKYMTDHEAVGGIAVPDGDVHYIFRRFGLKPKKVAHTTEITGNNCMFKAAVLEKHKYDPALREGEDVDLSLRLRRAGVSMCSVPGLYVEHREHKNFRQTFHWLYECGLGATRQLMRFWLIRLADYAFIGFVAILALLVAELALHGSAQSLILVPSYLVLTSFFHLRSKFEIEWGRIGLFIAAVLANCLFMLAYFSGRILGIPKLLKGKALSAHKDRSFNEA